MIGDRLDVVVGVRIEVGAPLPLVAGALDDVEQMRNHAGRQKRLAVVVEVDAPGIAGAVAKDLERRAAWDDSARSPAFSGVRCSSGVPGLPTRECVNTPWQP